MKPQEPRQIHVRLPVPLYKALRFRCVKEDASIQDFVTRLLVKTLHAELENESAAHGAKREGRNP